MAIINDPRLYTGGDVLFPQPHVELFAQLQARKAARAEAFDNYIRDLNKNINPAGMRNQERHVFDEKLAAWQKYGMENRDAIRARKNGADLEFQRGYQDLLNTIAESKTEEEKKKPAVQMLLDPAKRDRLNNDAFIESIASHDAPIFVKDKGGNWIRNPQRQSLNYENIAFEPKPFDQDKYFKSFDDIKRSDLTPQVVKNPKDMTETITTTSVFKPEDKNLVATRAVSAYMNDPGFKKTIDNLNPAEYNDFFKDNFGRDIANEADLAAAFTLKGLQQKTIKQEVKDDTLKRQLYLANYRHALGLGDKEDADLWINNYLDNIDQSSIGKNKTLLEGAPDVVYPVNLDPTLRKALDNPDKLFIDKNGKYYPVYYEYSKDGVIKGSKGEPKIDMDMSKPLSRQQVVLALGGKTVTRTKVGAEVEDSTKPSKYSNIRSANYRGQKIQMGVKNGKWYNVDTGEEIK